MAVVAMGASDSMRAEIVHKLEAQCHELATSMKNGLPGLRESIWGWPSSHAGGSEQQLEPCSSASAVDMSRAGPCDVDGCEAKASPAYAPMLEAVTAAAQVQEKGPRPGLDANWHCIRSGRLALGEVFFELVVSDLDSQFTGACRSLLDPLLRDSGGVRVRHETLQRAIADSLREPDVHTFVVFGSYGTFPDPDSRALMTWLSKVFIAPFFPNSWSSFARQCPSSADDEDLPWMDRKGQVWMAEPEIQDALTLVACAAYPRDQQPTEAEAAARRYEAALALIASTAGMSGCRGQKTTATPPKRIRVITHAIGSFVGHDDVSVFAQGLAEGVRRFLSSVG